MRVSGAVLENCEASAPFALSRPVTVGDLELDPPGPGELLVRVEAAGLCHSDLSVVNGSRLRPTPMLLGHEAAGIVTELGPGVTDIREGDRVVLTFLPRCGSCEGCRTEGLLPCIPGTATNTAGVLASGAIRLHRDAPDGSVEQVRHHLGVSAFATHAVVSRTSVVPVPSDVPPEIAALLGCAVLTGGGAVRNVAQPMPGDTVAVVGLGGVGMAALLVALAEDHDVIAVDTMAVKRETAMRLGASRALTPDEAIAEGVRARTVIEAAGSARALETAFALTSPGGCTVTVGLPAPDARAAIAPLTLTAEARTVRGSYLGSSVPERDIPRYVDLWRAGRLPLHELVSARCELSDINEAMDRLASGAELRQLITF